MKRVATISQVVVKGGNGKPKYLSQGEGVVNFRREVEDQESLEESVNLTFEEFGLDTTDIDKTLLKVEEEKDPYFVNVWYRLEVDPLSLLEFLISEEGRNSGLELIDLD